MNTKGIWLVLFLFTLSGIAVAQEGQLADVTLTVDNRGAKAFYLSAATPSSDIAELEADNADWTLTMGRRYRVLNQGGAAYHPFELRGGGDVLLAQLETSVGALEANTEIAFESDAKGVTFTLTPALAQVLTSYNCTYHAAMTGDILVVQP